MTLNFEFESPLKSIQEVEGLTYVTGTLISEGISKNDREYSLDMISEICKQALSKPVCYGTVRRIDSNGVVKVLHNEENVVGRIIATWRKGSKVFFKALISNADLAKKINENYGVSVGGIATEYSLVHKLGRKILKLISMVVTHVAIVSPSVTTGFSEAKVQQVVHETMTFFQNDQELTDEELCAVIEGLERSGNL